MKLTTIALISEDRGVVGEAEQWIQDRSANVTMRPPFSKDMSEDCSMVHA